MVGNGCVQAQYVPRARNLGNDGLAFAGRSREFRLPCAQDEYPSRSLAFDKEHCGFGVEGGGFNFGQLLHRREWQVTEEMLFAHRADYAIIDNIEPVRR